MYPGISSDIRNFTPTPVVYQFSEKRCRPNVPSRPLKRRLRRRLSGPRINVWATPFFGKLKGKNWKGKRVEERMRKCLLQNEIENAKCHVKKKRIRRERWTVTISLNIDFFFHLWSTSLSSIREIRRRLRGPRINVSPSLFFGKLKGGNCCVWPSPFLNWYTSWKGTKKDFQGRLNTGSKCLLRNAMRKKENSKGKKENTKCHGRKNFRFEGHKQKDIFKGD